MVWYGQEAKLGFVWFSQPIVLQLLPWSGGDPPGVLCHQSQLLPEHFQVDGGGSQIFGGARKG